MKSRKPKYRDRLKDPYIGLFSHVSTLSDVIFFGISGWVIPPCKLKTGRLVPELTGNTVVSTAR